MRYWFTLLLAACTGCATIISGGGHTQSVRFSSVPRGASVYVDDNLVGKTPTATDLTRKDTHIVRMELNGQVQTVTISRGMNLWMFGNIVFGGLIGVVVDLCSGAGDTLNPNDVNCTFRANPPDHQP